MVLITLILPKASNNQLLSNIRLSFKQTMNSPSYTITVLLYNPILLVSLIQVCFVGVVVVVVVVVRIKKSLSAAHASERAIIIDCAKL